MTTDTVKWFDAEKGFGFIQPDGLRVRLLHDRGAMVLDRALADAQVSGNILAGMALENRIHHLMLSLGEAGDWSAAVSR